MVSAEEVVLLRVIVVYCYVYGTRLGPRRPRTPFLSEILNGAARCGGVDRGAVQLTWFSHH